MMSEVDRSVILAELERARQTFHDLLDQATPADLRRRSSGTKWNNEQLLFHMLFGYLVVRALIPIVRCFGLLPPSASRAFAWLLNAGRAPFNAVNYAGSRVGAVVFNAARMGRRFDRVADGLRRRLERTPESALRRGMHFPVSWDPFFRDYMTLADVYAYPTKHFEFHRRQLSLGQADGRQPPGSRGL